MKYLPDIFKKQNIMFTVNEDKNSICQKLHIHMYIDDKVSVLEKIKSVNKKFLFDPYNLREDFDLGDIYPVSSWNEFLQHIQRQKS